MMNHALQSETRQSEVEAAVSMLRRAWTVIRRGSAIIITIALAGAGFAGVYVWLKPSAYVASSRLLIDNRLLALGQNEAIYSVASAPSQQLVQSQIEILHSSGLAQQVIERLDLLQHRELVGPGRLDEVLQPAAGASSIELRRALGRFQSRLGVSQVGQSFVVDVRFRSEDAERAAAIVNALVDAYLKDQASARDEAARPASGWLRERMRSLGTTARVLSAAHPPLDTAGPAPTMIVIAGGLVGLLLGLGVVLLRDLFDQRVRSGETLRAVAGVSLLGFLPSIIPRRKGRLSALRERLRASPQEQGPSVPLHLQRDAKLDWAVERTRSSFAHCLRRIRAKLHEQRTRQSAAVIGISSALPGEGKTLVAANLARLSAAAGEKVLLVDGSHYTSRLTRTLAPASQRGILDLLAGAPLSDVTIYDELSGAAFLPGVTADGLAAGSLVQALELILPEARQRFDVIVVDLPPLLPVADAQEITPLLDGMVLVLEWGRCTRDELAAAVSSVPGRSQKIAGAILNKADPMLPAEAGEWRDQLGLSSIDAHADERLVRPVRLPSRPAGAGDRQAAERRWPISWKPARRRAVSMDARPHRHWPAALRAALTACTVAIGLLAAAPQPLVAESYQLDSGDKLRIRVDEWPNLSGDFSVNPSGTVALPLLGELPASGVTPRELARAIASQLQDKAGISTAPSATVEVLEFRPFFAMGDVARPGAFPSRPGLIVLHAVSLAGGFYRSTDATFTRDAVTASGDIEALTREARQLVARVGRLEAEQKNETQIAFPPPLDDTPGSDDETIMAGERAILTANNEALANKIELLAGYQKLYEQEITSLQAQIVAERRTYASVKSEFEGLKQLAERGLTAFSRQIASERSLTQILGSIQGLEATILRARQNISEADQRRIEARDERMRRIVTDLQTARAEQRGNTEKLRVARQLKARAIAMGVSSGSIVTTYKIIRGTGETARELVVDRTSPVLPGDVLLVEREAGSSTEQAAGTVAGRQPTPSSKRTDAEQESALGN